MKNIIIILAALMFAGCRHKLDQKNKTTSVKHIIKKVSTADTAEKPIHRYSDQQLEIFLDSVGHLPAQPLVDKAAFGPDSVFRSPTTVDTLISPEDFAILKRAARKGEMEVKTARRIFKNNTISYDCNAKGVLLTYEVGLIPVVYTPFTKDTKAFNEFSLCIGDPGNCGSAILYFFTGRRIIAIHDGYNRNAPELAYFKDSDGKTVVYYGKQFDSGSGIWWFNYFFYKYEGNKLIPVLNIPQNINLLQPSPWCVRELWIESFIQKTNPLVIKMVYHQQLPDTQKYDHFTTDPNLGPMIVNDSTYVRYSWNEKTKSFEGNFNGTKINQAQILSYYLIDNELLFINAYNKNLKVLLHDKAKRGTTLHYLNEIKYYTKENKGGR